MKQAKLMLSAIAIVGVLGGAFAFKAKSAFGQHIFTGTNGVCTTRLDNATIGGTAALINASTQSTSVNCPLNHTVQAN